MLRLALMSLALSAAFGQSFEVASIRPVQPTGGGRGMEGHGVGREQIQIAPAGVVMRNASLRTMTRWAYRVTEYQVTGPDWIASQRFDVTAKASTEVSEDQLRKMMQTLLADRFKMESRRQTKEMQAFVLQVAKGGPKFKASDSMGEGEVKADKDLVLTARRTQVSTLIDTLTGIFKAPIIDQTGLNGKYDVVLNAGKYVTEMHTPDAANPPDPQAIVMRGLQEELGLRLDSKKMPVDLIVIDRAEKLPAEN